MTHNLQRTIFPSKRNCKQSSIQMQLQITKLRTCLMKTTFMKKMNRTHLSSQLHSMVHFILKRIKTLSLLRMDIGTFMRPIKTVNSNGLERAQVRISNNHQKMNRGVQTRFVNLFARSQTSVVPLFYT